jgi:glycosyltransferase involved in cell wall biosynthesis
MNICMVLADRDFPPDLRVEKEARSLRDAGYNILILSAGLGDRPTTDEWEGCRIVRVPRRRGLFDKLNSLLRLGTFFDIIWYRALLSIIQQNDIDVLHVHDLPMLGTALFAGTRCLIPVIADLHENFPAALQYYLYPPGSMWDQIKNFLFFRQNRWQVYEISCSKKADHIFVVVNEAKDRLVKEGIQPDKITVVENTEDIELFESIPIDEQLLKQNKLEFVISYIGGFGGEHRGLDTAIAAMPTILKVIPQAKLLLVGDGPIKYKLEKLVTTLSLENYVEFISWQPFERIPTYIALSDVCLVPHQSNPHTEATSPHKLFQYMLMEKPVVVSNCRPLSRIVNTTGGGLVFKAGDSQSLAQAVIAMKDGGVRKKMGRAGRRAVLEIYNWEQTSRRLVAAYNRILSNGY